VLPSSKLGSNPLQSVYREFTIPSLKVAVASLHELGEHLSDGMRHSHGDAWAMLIFGGGETANRDLDSKGLAELVKVDVALGPADGVLHIGSGGLAGKDDASGATLGVTSVGSDIGAHGHGRFLGGVKRGVLEDFT
jgi:hypothetical protein